MTDELVRYLHSQRWFGGKARQVTSAGVVDAARLDGARPATWLAIVEVRYADEGIERYHLAFSGDPVRAPMDIAADTRAARDIFAAMIRGTTTPGQHGTVSGHLLRRDLVDEHVDIDDVAPLPAAHSNTAFIVGQRYLLKLFRRVGLGLNPDVEIGRMLAQRSGSVPTPALLGTLDYRTDHSESTLALLQVRVQSEQTAWEAALDAVQTAIDGGTPTPFDRSIGLLGRRTAELHLALAEGGAPDFEPQLASRRDLDVMIERVSTEAERAFHLLERSGDPSPAARRVLAQREKLLAHVQRLGAQIRPFLQIRIHGDYHLGQVLVTPADFAIIDFEGEPTRSLHERRARQSPLRDVAGMCRSFSYAAWTAVRASSSGTADAHARATAWEASASSKFREGYGDGVRGTGLVPEDAAQADVLLELFTIDKALYELAYELNNRPDWVAVPLAGIEALALEA